MSQSSTEPQAPVAVAVRALLGPSRVGGGQDLRASIERAAAEIDGREVEAHYRALVEHLEEEPGAPRVLEALVVLGLAHPRLLARHRIGLAREGRRLARLLEEEGDVERAQVVLEALASRNPDDGHLQRELASMMQRTGNADRLIERYLRRAESALGQGRRGDAVVWLRQVLAIDRSRRDVARMIRDLQYEELDRRRTLVRSLKLALLLLAVTLPIAGAVWRETSITGRYRSLAAAEPGNLASLQARLESIDELIASNPLWLGAFEASRERASLRSTIALVEADRAGAELAREGVLINRVDTADSARLRGRSLVLQGDYGGALVAFRSALRAAPPEWEGRARLEADIAAIEQLLAAGGAAEERP